MLEDELRFGILRVFFGGAAGCVKFQGVCQSPGPVDDTRRSSFLGRHWRGSAYILRINVG